MSSSPQPEPRAAAATLRTGRDLERSGQLTEAAAAYEETVRLAEESAERVILAQGLRRLGVVHHRRNQLARGIELCQRSYDEAVGIGDLVLAGEALNALGGFDLEAGAISTARWNYQNALALSGEFVELRARIDQNLGIICSIQGDYDAALAHYKASIAAFESAGDEHGAALGRHNLGLLAIRMGELDLAARLLIRGGETARRLGDVHLQALCDLSSAELFHACRQYDDALKRAQATLAAFERLDCPIDQSGACRVLGMIYRDTGRPIEAAERLQTALALAIETGWVLGQAEAQRELAILELSAGHWERASFLFASALDLFTRLESWMDMADIRRRIEALTEPQS